MSFAVMYSKAESDSDPVWHTLHDEVPPQDVCHVHVISVTIGTESRSLTDTATSLNRVAHSIKELNIVDWGKGSAPGTCKSLTDLGDVMHACPQICLHNFQCTGGIADLSAATGDLLVDSSADMQELRINPENTGSITLRHCPKLISIRALSGRPLQITSLDMSACAWQLAKAVREHFTHLQNLTIRGMAMHGQLYQPAWLPESLETLTLYKVRSDGTDSVVLADLPALKVFVALACEHVTSITLGQNLPSLSSITAAQLPALHTLASAGSDSLAGLPRLEELICNKCSSLASLSVEGLPLLRAMTVEHCPSLSSFIVNGSTLPSLKILALSSNKLGDSGCKFGGRFDNLAVLSAINEDLTKVPIDPKLLNKLMIFDMSRNRCWRPVDLSFSPDLLVVRFEDNTPEPVDMFGRQNKLRIIVRRTVLGMLPEFVSGPQAVMVLCDSR